MNKQGKSNPRPSRRTVAGKRRPALESILVLECDAKRLELDGISMAADVHSMVQRLLPAVRSELVQVTTEGELLADFAARAVGATKYDLVLIVGHSNLERLALARDSKPRWPAVAKWIEPFSPRVAVLAACQGGRWLPSEALFDGIDSLQEIYGTPVLSTQAQLRVLQLLVLYLLAGGRVARNWLSWGQIATFALTDGVIFRQTRAEIRASGPAEAATWTILEDALRKLLDR